MRSIATSVLVWIGISGYSQVGIGVHGQFGFGSKAHQEYVYSFGFGLSLHGRALQWLSLGLGTDNNQCRKFESTIVRDMTFSRIYFITDFAAAKRKIISGFSLGRMQTLYHNDPVYSGQTEILPVLTSGWRNWFAETHVGYSPVKGLSANISYTYTFRDKYAKFLFNDCYQFIISYIYEIDFSKSDIESQ